MASDGPKVHCVPEIHQFPPFSEENFELNEVPECPRLRHCSSGLVNDTVTASANIPKEG